MAQRIEDYALIGDTMTAALVGRNGSIDWLCLPRFDSAACFAALVGSEDNGCWRLAPAAPPRAVRRRYRGETLVLETEFETGSGTVAVIDLMPRTRNHERADILRIVEGRAGSVAMRMDLVLRFAYGRIIPWITLRGSELDAVAGPDGIHLASGVPLEGDNHRVGADFDIGHGERVEFRLTWYPSHHRTPPALDPGDALADTEAAWTEWSARCTASGRWREPVMRSLLTLKALTYSPTGGIVAAPTTSLPEWIGGPRNWDYRFCWLRDATLTLYALLSSGYHEEALAWRDWLLRAVAGEPSQTQMIYGIRGERLLAEYEAPWLAGYEASRPVRIGNAAHMQFQLDVHGEVQDALHGALTLGRLDSSEETWRLRRCLLDSVEASWRQPDHGLWEVRNGPRHFVHSKVMAWVAVDRMIRDAERFGLEAPLERWRSLRRDIHDEVCRRGFDQRRGSFVQHFGSTRVDAALLMIPLVGFLPASDPRVVGTVHAVESDLMADGLVRRYRSDAAADGLPPGEGAFLACSFWLACNYALLGRRGEAERLFEHLLSLRNDVGLLAEEYDPVAGRQLGNFPQAFSHVALISTANSLASTQGPAQRRAGATEAA